MLQIENYKIKSELHSTQNFLILKAIREYDNFPVIIKILKKEYPSFEQIKKLKYEYEILKKLSDIEDFIKNVELLKIKNSFAIIMEDIEGISLDKLLEQNDININLFFKIAIKLVEILGKIHKQNIIHKDIKPSNIIINLDNFKIQIIDFSISSELTRESQEAINPDYLEGTLAYISPEQTGRMNRVIDYRTDFYSLGVTFYEMLTKKYPFYSKDPLELIYFHITKEPLPPHKINKDIPVVISDIILKLLSKTAEERYQSTSGLISDLKKCHNQFIKYRKINNFKLGKNDASDKFQIPEKIYGRENDIKQLLDAFDQTSKGKRQIIFIKGEAGIGKSSLINEIHKPIIKNRGYFISGKFDKYKKMVLYSAIIQAFKELIKYLFTEKKEKIAIWKKNILKAVGSNGQIIINIIPEIELIIDKQPELQNLPPNEAQNRFNLVFINFVKVFAQQNHPLVLFIDDLQWADSSSLQLLELLLNDSELNYFMFIGAFRDNEIDKTHLLTTFFINLEKNNKLYHNISINSLNKENIMKLISDTLHTNETEMKDLAILIYDKTLGNPFFIKEFLRTLNDKKLIFYNKKWKWDILKIKKTDITDNVVELMIEKIISLEKNILDIIKVISCLGISANIKVLTKLNNIDELELLFRLKKAIDYGYLIKIKNNIRFTHDRIREAVYTIIPDLEKKKIHYNIGLYLLNDYKKNKDDDLIFNIVNQLNLAIDLLNDDFIKVLIELNYKAAVKAKTSAAFSQANEYFRCCSNLLKENIWDTDYIFALNFFTEWAETEYIVTNIEEANKIIDQVLKKAKNTFDKVKAYLVLLTYYNTHMLFKESVNLGINIINELGYKFPDLKKINFFKTITEIIKFNILINKKKKELKVNKIIDLVNLPVTSIKEINEIIMILLNIGETCYISYPEKYPFLITRMVNYALKYGLTNKYFGGIIALGGVFAIGLKKYNLGYELGVLELKLLEKSNDKFLKCFCKFLFSITIVHYKKHIKESLNYLIEAYQDGLDSGNNQYTSYAINHICIRYFFIENNLETVKNYYDKYTLVHKRLKQKDSDAFFYPPKQIVYNLLNLSEDKFKLKGEDFNEEIDVDIIKKFGFTAGLFIYYTFKLILTIILDDYKNCLIYVNESMNYLKGNYGQFQGFFYILFVCLTYLLNINNMTKKEKRHALKYVIQNQKNFKRLNQFCSENFGHMFYIVSAELAAINNNDTEAMIFFDKAIQSAKDNQFLFMEAISNELAAKYYQTKKLNKIFQTYMIEACYCYMKWGAKAKIVELEKKYPELFRFVIKSENTVVDVLRKTLSTASSMDNPSSLTYTSIDLETIMRASQTISSEIKMDSLLRKLIKIVIENAGAQKGIIIINKNEELLIEAEISNENKELILLKSQPVLKNKKLSHAIVNYVFRTKEIIKLDDASNKGQFINESYIQENKPKSILCLPIIFQKNLSAILYLENNISTHAFKDQHIEILKILSSQAAISINNIYLYENIKEKELLEKELRLAAEIQNSMFPKELPEIEGFDLNVACLMSKGVGGDLYDIIPISDKIYLFVIGDVSGKGMSAALYMSSVINMIKVLIEGDKDRIKKINSKLFLKNILIQLNKVLKDTMKKSNFVTLLFGLLNIETNSFIYTNSGHGPIYLYNPKNKKFLTLITKGMACGSLPSKVFDSYIEEKEVIINKNDFIIFNTDGITEARNKNNIEYNEKFINNIKNLKENDTCLEGINKILKDYYKFIKNEDQFDDITLICIKKI